MRYQNIYNAEMKEVIEVKVVFFYLKREIEQPST